MRLILNAALGTAILLATMSQSPTPTVATATPEPSRPVPSFAYVAPTAVASSSTPSPTPAATLRPTPKPTAKPTYRYRVSGTVSTYGPGYDGYLALPLPWGRGWRVTICGQGGCVRGVSNDTGPVLSLHRIADLDVRTFEAVCGVVWTRGLCKATVTIWGRA